MRNVFFMFLFFAFISCNGQPETTLILNPDSFEKVIAENLAQVLDVRTSAEFNSGHIKSALQADWNNNKQFNERIQYVDKDKPVYVYCLVGGRSAAAANWMRANGFKDVIELKGGINAWKQAGKPLEGQSNIPQMTLAQYQSNIPATGTVLVDFGADWCPPCVKMEPVLNEIRENKNLVFEMLKVDAGVHSDLMKSLELEPIPAFIIYKNGKEVWRKEGIVSKEEFELQLK